MGVLEQLASGKYSTNENEEHQEITYKVKGSLINNKKLKWKTVSFDNSHFNNFDDGCILGLEELDSSEHQVMRSMDGTLTIGNLEKLDEKKEKKQKPNSISKVSSVETKDTKKSGGKKKKSQVEKKEKKNVMKEDGLKKEEGVSSWAKKNMEELSKVESLSTDPLPNWKSFNLHPYLYRSLRYLDFLCPTPIQKNCLSPAVCDNRDIVGAAETGSGKTLAFGIPILHHLLTSRDENAPKSKHLSALILTPTRELALQVRDHITKAAIGCNIQVVAIVGGMSSQKQDRLLSYFPEIVVGTPGRLWDLIDHQHPHFVNLGENLRFLVVDEADRMVETGNYPEVQKVFDLLVSSRKKKQLSLNTLIRENDDEVTEKQSWKRSSFVDNSSNAQSPFDQDNEQYDDEEYDDQEDPIIPSDEAPLGMLTEDILKRLNKDSGQLLPESKEEQDDLEDDDLEEEQDDDLEEEQEDDLEEEAEDLEDMTETKEENESTFAKTKDSCLSKGEMMKHLPRQTFLFSATLTLEEKGRQKKKSKRNKKNQVSVLEAVMKQVGLRGKPAVVDLTQDTKQEMVSVEGDATKEKKAVVSSLPSGLQLCEIECIDKERDMHLHYFLCQYTGKTIIFLNSISQVRKLSTLLGLLHFPVFGLHAEMQQKQRLKKLDRFRETPNAILVATDVAARGLDIPTVEYVIHYHIPRSTEIFIHRSGRTARGQKNGLSLSIVSPAEMKTHTQICHVLHRPSGLDRFPLDLRFLPRSKLLTQAANEVYQHENQSKKVSSTNNWFKQMAQEADITLDDNLLVENEQKHSESKGLKKAKAKLAQLLAEPVRAIGDKRKFRDIHSVRHELTSSGEYKVRDASKDLKSSKRFRRRR